MRTIAKGCSWYEDMGFVPVLCKDWPSPLSKDLVFNQNPKIYYQAIKNVRNTTIHQLRRIFSVNRKKYLEKFDKVLNALAGKTNDEVRLGAAVKVSSF